MADSLMPESSPAEIAAFLVESAATAMPGRGRAGLWGRLRWAGKEAEARTFAESVVVEIQKLRSGLDPITAMGIACHAVAERWPAKVKTEEEKREGSRAWRAAKKKANANAVRRLARMAAAEVEAAMSIVPASRPVDEEAEWGEEVAADGQPPDESPAVGAPTHDGEFNPTFDLIRDIVWAQQNRTNRGATKRQAPSLSAWDMLQFARENRNDFYNKLLPKAFAAQERKTAGADGDGKDKDRDLGLDEVQRLLREIESD